MDFHFTPEQQKLRKEFRDVFTEWMKEAPERWYDMGGYARMDDPEAKAFDRKIAKKLGERQWISLGWPKEYYGLGYEPVEQMIFNEEMARLQVPGRDFAGCLLLAPTLMVYGTEEQKKRFLEPIAKGEIVWMQGWSEPNAGSDLASLTTRADDKGDYFIVNGQKTWQSNPPDSDWIFILARSDPELPRHRGLSYFLIDMKTPGITVPRVNAMDNKPLWCEVFFDDVKVPKENMLGEKNRGWYVTMATANFERSGSGAFVTSRIELQRIIDFCKETKWHNKYLIDNDVLRHRLAQCALEIEVGHTLAYRIIWHQIKKEDTTMAASINKNFNSEYTVRFVNLVCHILGLYSQLAPESKLAPLWGRWEWRYLEAPGGPINVGSSEIQRNIIAWRGLDLPRYR